MKNHRLISKNAKGISCNQPNEMIEYRFEKEEVEINASEVSTKIVDIKMQPSSRLGLGFGYREGLPLQFTSSLDSHALEIVTIFERNPSTQQMQYHLYLVGTLYVNAVIDNLYPIGSSTTISTAVSSSDESVVNEDLGFVSSKEELELILETGVNLVVDEVIPTIVTATGEVIEFDPESPEVFYEEFNGEQVLQYIQKMSAMAIVGPTPIS